MATPNATVWPESRHRYWLRVLRPLVWWFILVLVLFVYHEHLIWSERTRLNFSVVLERQDVTYEAAVKMDTLPVMKGGRIPLGWHTLIISHPKADTITSNLFVWYGEHNWGEIVLNRSKGTLAIQANPPAALLTVHGPEFAVTLTNTSGMTSSVPTDAYSVEAKYLHWQEDRKVAVSRNSLGSWSFAPRLGALQLSCNQAGASFQVLKSDNQLLEAGEFPTMLREVPAGSYKVIASHHGNQREQALIVKAGSTNDLMVEFAYGAATFETEPPGATVQQADGRIMGTTPFTVLELQPGTWRFTLRRDGFEPAQVSLTVSAQETNSFRTNLISINYVRAVTIARQYLAAADYGLAITAAADALQAKPNDPIALAVQNEAKGRRNLRQAEAFGKQGDYTSGIKELELALEALPENEEARQLLADFKTREPSQIERLRKERSERPKKVYDALVAKTQYASLFDSHELKTGKPYKEVERAILDALRNVKPAFKVTRDASTEPGTVEIEAGLELTTALGTSAGGRICLIVLGQTTDDETQILFRVLEFKAEAVEKFSIGAIIGAPVKVNYIPLHASQAGTLTDKMKAQMEEGTKLLTERIRGAIDEPR